MQTFLLLLCLACFSFSQVSFAGISGSLQTIAYKHSGHRTIETHAFILELKENRFRWEEIAQYFQDRIYISKIMEVQTLSKLLAEDLGDLDRQIFFRSLPYQLDLEALIGKWMEIPPSAEAMAYGHYLESQPEDVVSLHHWLFLLGETFGTQHINQYIKNKYKGVGIASMNFGVENSKLHSVRGVFNRWLDHQLKDSHFDFEGEITLAYLYFLNLSEAALKTAPVSKRVSANAVLSQWSHWIFGK